jgi:hypothetical protein
VVATPGVLGSLLHVCFLVTGVHEGVLESDSSVVEARVDGAILAVELLDKWHVASLFDTGVNGVERLVFAKVLGHALEVPS